MNARPLAALVAATLLGCATGRHRAPFAEPPADDPRLVLGERVFDAHCHTCHPGGEAGIGLSLTRTAYPGWVIRFQVRTGVGEMPRFPEDVIPDDELDAVVAYIKWLRRYEPLGPEGSRRARRRGALRPGPAARRRRNSDARYRHFRPGGAYCQTTRRERT